MRLTRDEIKLVAFILAAVVLGVTVKHYRHRGRDLPPPPAAPATPPPNIEIEVE